MPHAVYDADIDCYSKYIVNVNLKSIKKITYHKGGNDLVRFYRHRYVK